MSITLAAIEAARHTIAGQVLRTPMLPARRLSELTGMITLGAGTLNPLLCGCRRRRRSSVVSISAIVSETQMVAMLTIGTSAPRPSRIPAPLAAVVNQIAFDATSRRASRRPRNAGNRPALDCARIMRDADNRTAFQVFTNENTATMRISLPIRPPGRSASNAATAGRSASRRCRHGTMLPAESTIAA